MSPSTVPPSAGGQPGQAPSGRIGRPGGEPTATVLVVEDEPAIATAIAQRLVAEGWRAEVARDGLSGVEAALRLRPDAIVLDVMLPGIDGLEATRRIQAEQPTPILMLTARDDETDMIIGLGVGADDYMTKPFSMRELVARLKALMRRMDRAAQAATSPVAQPPLEIGDVTIDTAQRRVYRAGEEIHLTPTEFELLVMLAGSPRTVLTREKLLAEVWDWADASGTRTVDSHIKALRRKLGPDLIRTVHGVGYAFEPGTVTEVTGSEPSDEHERDDDWTRTDPTGPRVSRGTDDTDDHFRLRRTDGVAKAVARVPDVRPLDRLTSIRTKLGVLVALTVSFASFVTWVGLRNHLGPTRTLPLAIVLSLLLTQVLARGMTSPLREMTSAARAMADGDYSRRVRATSRDEVGQLAGAFNQMAADLEASDRMRRDLVANVSHELRTPVAGLHAQLENIVDGVTPATPATLQTALTQTERLSRLVTYLLDLSRIEAGASELNVEPIPLGDFLEEVAESVSMLEAGKQLRYVVDVSPEDLEIEGDPVRLDQVVTNLLHNAIRYSPSDGVIRIEAFAAVSGDDVLIDVVDEGPGIAPEDRERIFDRFQRGSVPAKGGPSTGGTGIGLAIVRWAVELHGGRIAVVDDPRGGARMRLTLPRRHQGRRHPGA